MASWIAAKSYITALYMNDVLVISGSNAGMVKLWELQSALKYESIAPLKKIAMRGIRHYPIKTIGQLGYLDLVVVAKYEGKKRKDKVKLIQVKSHC